MAKSPSKLGAADFEFRVGNSNDPSAWVAAPQPASVTVRTGEGLNGSDRVTLIWPDGAIDGQWLQVTVLATPSTNLAEPDVFYFGNAIGETGNSTTDAKVNAFDMLGARDNPRSFLDPAPIDFAYDFDRDQRVNATDMLIARDNPTSFLNALRLIVVPSPGAGRGGGAGVPPYTAYTTLPVAKAAAHDGAFEQQLGSTSRQAGASAMRWRWLWDLDPTGLRRQSPRHGAPVACAVDTLLATGEPGT